MNFPYTEGSILSGTLRIQDILPVCLKVMQQVSPQAYADFMADEPFPKEALQDDDNAFWQDELSQWIKDEIVEVINTSPNLPEDLYFGPHPADGADLGFWAAAAAF